MTAAPSAGSRRRALLAAGLLAAVTLALPACVAPAAVLAAGAVSGLVGSAGGGGGQATGSAMRPGAGVQNGRRFDESIGQALAASRRSEPTAACRALLPEPQEPLPGGQCDLRPVCLPGAAQPMELHVCGTSSPPS